jgi:hypothetical protein
VEKAENLNESLRSELDRIRNDHATEQRSLRDQIDDLESNPPQQSYNGGSDEWRQRCEELERELSEQQQVAEEVRRDAPFYKRCANCLHEVTPPSRKKSGLRAR